MNNIKVGDIAKCIRWIRFADGSSHKPGQEIEINKDNISYFELNSKDYII